MKLSISAFCDLAIGVLLVFSLGSPLIFSMLDPKAYALLGIFAILMIGGEGTGLVIMLFFLKRVEQWIERLNVGFITGAFLSYKRWFYTFLVSSCEGLALFYTSMIIFLILASPIILINPSETVSREGSSYTGNPGLQAVAKETLGWFTTEYTSWFSLSILIIACSYFSLFLLKTMNFSILRIFQTSKETKVEYEKLLSLAKGEEVDLKELKP